MTFGSLVAQYRGMVGPEDATASAAILSSLERRWSAADQDVFIGAVLVNPFFRATPFIPRRCFVIAHMKSLLSQLYSCFFASEPPPDFSQEVHEYLFGSGHYSELDSTCAAQLTKSRNKVCSLFITSEVLNTDPP